MNTQPRALVRRSRELFNVDYMPPEVNKANQRRWVRAVIDLGDRWKLRNPVPRLGQ